MFGLSIFDIIFSRGNERQIIQSYSSMKLDRQPPQPADIQEVMDDVHC